MSDKKYILVVDDEDDILAYLGAMLEDNGYEVAFAKDGIKAMEMIKARRPDLITLDITMPEQSGVRTYRELKTDESLKKIPVIIVTGVDLMRIYMQKLAGFPFPEAFFTKPIEKDEFLQTISEQLKK